MDRFACDWHRLAEPGTPTLRNHLIAGSLVEIEQAMNAAPTFRAEYEAYLARFGERTVNELKLESATLHDDPLPLLRAVGNLAQLSRPAGEYAETSDPIPSAGVREESSAGGRRIRESGDSRDDRRLREGDRSREDGSLHEVDSSREDRSMRGVGLREDRGLHEGSGSRDDGRLRGHELVVQPVDDSSRAERIVVEGDGP